MSTPPDSGGRRLVWLVAGLTVFSACAVLAALVYLRTQALGAGETLSESLVHSVSEQTSRAFQATDQRLQLAASHLESLQAAQRLNEDSARAMLREQLQQLPFVRAIWVLDQQGQILFDSDVGNIGIKLADREYFQVYQQQPAAGFHLSAPVRSRSTGTWLISASRPLRSADGSLTGVIVAAIEPPYFDKLWGEIRLAAGGAIALFRQDGVLMMRSPAADAFMGKVRPDLPLFGQHLSKALIGSYLTRSALESRIRFVSYRTLAAYPDLIVALGRTESDVLGPWTRFALLTTSIWLAAITMLMLLSWRLLRQSRQRRHTEQRFLELAQAMPQVVFIADNNDKLSFVSEQWTTVTGQSTDSAMAGDWLSLIHPDDREQALADARQTRATGISTLNEHRLLCKDGVYRWHLARSTPIRDKQGKITAWYGTSTDIDELKQAEVALKTQTDLTRLASHLAKVGGWSIDVATNSVTLADEAAQALGWPPGTPVDLAEAIALFLPESRERITRLVQACIRDGTPYPIFVTWHNKSELNQ